MTTQLFTDSATNNFDAERAVVGAMFGLLGDEPEAMTTMRTLEPQHFLSRDLGAVYGAISGRLKAGESVDFLIIADDLDRAYGPCPLPCGWVGYCVDLSSEATPNLFHAPEYAKMVREAFLRREVTEAGAQLVKLAHNPGGDVRPAMLFARRLLESFDGDLYDQETGDVGEALAEIGSERQTGYPIGVPAMDAWLGGIVKGRMLAISGPPGVGKAQPHSSMVLTPSGWKRMGEILPGDMVIGASGKPVKVLETHPQGVQPTYTLTFRDGAKTRCTADHLWRVQNTEMKLDGNRWRVLSLSRIIEGGLFSGGKAKHFIPMVGPVEFAPRGDLPVDPYVLGVLLGDAHLRLRGNSGEVLLTTPDAEVLDTVVARLPGIKANPMAGSTISYRLVGDGGWRENWLIDALKGMGLMGKLAQDKRVPDAYLFSSPADRLDLLRGLMDSDGTVTAKSGTPSFSSASRNLAEAVRFLVRSLGGRASLAVKKTTHLDSYRVNIGLPRGVQPFLLERKARLANIARPKYLPTRALIDVRPDGEEECTCISVEAPDGLYVTDDFIVTHNTWLTALLANAALDAGARVAFFSLEMSRADMILRLAVNRHGASLYRLNRPRSQWSDEDRDWYAKVAGDYSRLPLKVYSDQRDVDVICGLAKQHEADVVFLDYFQVLKKPADAKSEFEGPEILANRLHNLCTKGELRPAVIVGSQLTQDKIKFDAGAGSHGAFGLKFAAALGERSAGILKISSIEDTGGGPWHLHLKLEKNRFGFDHQSGASGKFVMDRATGLLRQVDGLMPARKPAAAAQPPTRARVEVPGW